MAAAGAAAFDAPRVDASTVAWSLYRRLTASPLDPRDDYAHNDVVDFGAAPKVVRQEPMALEIDRIFFAGNKPVAAICHGPQILISAGLLQGRRTTCYRSVADELKEAGALYEDRELVVDANLITSRQPADLPAFMREIMKQLRR